MKVHVLVEGQTEEVFIQRVVGPHFRSQQVFFTPIILSTKRTKDGRKFRGGLQKYEKLRRELQLLLADTSVRAVTTMVDFYGLPGDFPGLSDMPPGDPYVRVEHLEDALRRDVDNHRFVPYLSLHEFEALVLAGPDELTDTLPDAPDKDAITRVLALDRSPEEINDGEDTHPSARLATHLPRYQKTLHGPLITSRIGLQRLRETCPHFDAWIRQLETLTA